ncbi:translocation/assembly module TamB domain-containing protein [Marinobacterium sp. YM272]|uniref:translocation/assembly module TamB domain-containing protein n=1 Tax=Marinobacterium sp. YM272 TaxID=3421654 RepID=UPI003D800143
MRRTLRWVRRLVLAVVLLLVLSVGVLAFLAHSETGTRWVFDLAGRWLPALQLDSVSGTLTGPLRLEGLSYRPAQSSGVDIAVLELDWLPSRLFSRELALQHLIVDGVRLSLVETEQEPEPAPASQPFSLPGSLRLPLAVRIEQLSVSDVRIDGQPEPLVQSLNLKVAAQSSDVELYSLRLRSPRADLDLSGQAKLAGDYPLTLSSQAQVRLPGRPAIDLAGKLEGPLEKLSLIQQVRGPLVADLDARLNGILSQHPEWEAGLTLDSIDLNALVPEAAGAGVSDLSATLDASGSFDSAELKLDAALSQRDTGPVSLALAATADKNRIEVSPLSVVQSEGEARVELSGHMSPLTPEGELALDLSWQNLGYPLKTEAQTRSPKGSLAIRGQMNDYTADLDIALQAPAVEPVAVTGQISGNLQGLASLQLNARGPQGEADIAGSAAWQPQPGWDLTIESDGINPAYFAKAWPGSINTRLTTRGTIAEQQQITARIEQLDGTLREQAVSGVGNLSLQNGIWQIDGLALSWGDARVSTEGQAGEQLNLDFALDLPALAQLIPDASGRVNARGKITGTPTLPALDASLGIAELSWQSYAVAEAEGQVALDTRWQSPANIQLTAAGLSLAGQTLDQLSLSATGTDQALRTVLSLAQGENRLNTELNGKLSFDETAWGFDGQLAVLDLIQEQAGHWSLDKPAAIQLSPDNYRLGELCLAARGQSGRLCADGSFEAGNAQARFNLAQLPLLLAQPYLPVGADISGYLNGEGRFNSAGEQLVYSVDLQLPQAAISSPDTDLTLSFDTAAINLQGNEKQASARLNVPLHELSGALNASVEVQDPLAAARLDGQFSLELPDLKALNVLSSEVVVQSGQARADIRLAGTAAQPSLKGVFNLSEGDIELPGAGVRIQEISLDLRDANTADKLLLSGSVRSGDGSLALNGEIWPLQNRIEATLKGEGFQAVNTPELSVQVSPDMTLNASPERVSVGGVLAVPNALIKPPKPSVNAARRSQDLVVVEEGQGDAQSRGPELDVDLRVELGENVRVDAFGFDGLLQGALRVQQQGKGVARGTGRVGVASGSYELYGQKLNISRGGVLFSGGPLTNPGLDLRVDREIDDVSVGAIVSGTLRNPDMELTSTPAMPDNQILSYLILGRPPESASAGERELMMRMALSLAGGNKVAGRLQETFNVDELGFASGDNADETSFYIGKYLSPDLYIKYGVGLGDTLNTFLVRYRLTTRWLLESENSSEASGGDLIYSFER